MPDKPGINLPVVALVGNPNVGKSSLFNRITNSRQRIVNAPRTTVELARGTWVLPNSTVTVVDLPGTYDLDPASPDEAVTADALVGSPDLAIVFLDATALGRSLYLLAKVAATGTPIIIALTLSDVAATRGSLVDPAEVQHATGLRTVAIDPRTGTGIADLADLAESELGADLSPWANPDDAVEWAYTAAAQITRDARPARTIADRADGLLLRPWVGAPVFLAVLWALFQLATVAAAPFMDAVDWVWFGPITGAVEWLLPDGWFEDAIVGGIMQGVGMTLTFVPLMALMFLALALLEDSGYMARAAFVADRAMRAVGLDGQAVLPLVVGYGCNVPALAGLKGIPDVRRRVATALLIPFTSCTARLPVYVLVAAVFFPDDAGTVVFAMYLASGALVILGALLMKATLTRKSMETPTMLVLPPLQRPGIRQIGSAVWMRAMAFVKRAGTVIVVALAALWFLSQVPVTGGTWGNVAVEDSAYGATATAIAPVFAPAGFDDWRASAALVSGFIAKEIVVASLAQSYALDEPADASEPGRLGTDMRATFDESSGGHGQAAALAFLVFVLAYTPCVATLGEMRRQFGWAWTGSSVALSLSVAWVCAVAVFQIGSRL